MDALKDLANMLKDPQNSIEIGTVDDLELSEDRSVLRASILSWPDQQEIICRVSWSHCGPNAGVFMFPQIGDLVMFCLVSKKEDQSFVIKTLSSKEDTIPITAKDGSLVLRSISKKKSWLTSDTRINLSRGDTEPLENLVIGQKFKTTYLSHLSKLVILIEKLVIQRETDLNHTHIGIFGVPVNIPIQTTAMTAEKAELNTIKGEIETLKANDVESENILSDVSFTEK